MKYKDLVTSMVRVWNFTRRETLQLLDSLNDEKLLFKPEGEKWQNLAFQFGCMVQTQMVYAKAVIEERLDYSWYRSGEFTDRKLLKNKNELLDYSSQANKEWSKAVRKRRYDENFKIKWPGFNANLVTHISSLNGHERLHHGQIITYFTLAGFGLPTKFKDNWAL